MTGTNTPRVGARLIIAVVAALCIGAPRALVAQLAVTTHGVNLRPNHSSHDAPLRAIDEGDTLALLAPDTTNGYVHVRLRDDSTEGWVYSHYVAIVGSPDAGATGTAAPPGATAAVTTAPASYHGCPNVGRNNSGNTPADDVQTLNQLKNRYTAPTASDIDPAITVDALLAPGDDEGRFDKSKGAELVAVVTDVMVGGKETTNCEATDPMYRDTHIRISRTADAPETQRVVIEVTPRWRQAMANAGVDWSTATLKRTLVGKTVRVRGWMLFDVEHKGESENTNPGNAKNWRATSWEIHPITVLEVQ
jgi:hypothetical protein